MKAFIVIIYFWQGPVGSGAPHFLLGPNFVSQAECELVRDKMLDLFNHETDQAAKERVTGFEAKCVEFGK